MITVATKEERSRIETDLVNAVYTASVKIFESAEYKGQIYGNGHHMAQDVAEYARRKLSERWNENE